MAETGKCPECGADLPPDGICAPCSQRRASEAETEIAPTVSERPGASKRLEPSSGQPDNQPGDRIGPYRLLELIGEGGMGSVWAAEQREPVHRERVALKLIKLGMDTRQVIARFEAERQALALMDHPNIAKVLDAGATDTGRPYFVMEYVKGEPITHYCDKHNLPPRERLDLFIQVCKAVQHAHQKGIIHRDITPSNILVTLCKDERDQWVAVPKIIDFGIAKATEGRRLTEKTVYTALGEFVGKPAYMAPEQAEMSGLGIDTRSDIYALGVVLYELLTGQTPFEPRRLAQAGLEEICRIIREEEPARPSTKIGTLDDATQTAIAKRRRLEPPTLIRLVRGDLDWIVMKCLEKDRARRYETANGLALDIERYANNEVVSARPPSRTYRLQKLVRRNKVAFSTAAVVAIALVAGVAVSTWQAIRATRAEKRAETEAAKKVLYMMLNMGPETADFKMTENAVTMNWSCVTNEMAAKMLDAVVSRYGARLDAETKLMFGMMYFRISEFGKAEALLRELIGQQKKELGESDPGIADSLEFLAVVLMVGRRDMSGAEAVFREAYALMKKKPGVSDTELARCLNDIGVMLSQRGDDVGGEEKYREALGIVRKSRPKDRSKENPVIGSILLNLAEVLRVRKNLDEARSLAKEAIDFYERHPDERDAVTGRAFAVIGAVLKDTHEYPEALKWLRKAADQGNALAQVNLGRMYENGNGVPKDMVEAAKWYRKAAEQQNPWGENSLGCLYETGSGVEKNFAEAIQLYRKSADQGNESAQVNLGRMYENGNGVAKDMVEAAKWYRKAAEQGESQAQNSLGWLYKSGSGVETNLAEAVKWFRKSADLGNADGQNSLADMYWAGSGVTQNFAEAVKWYRKSADQGNAAGQVNLGFCNQTGSGVPKDAGEAVKWYRKSAEQGDADGQDHLGCCYENGIGVATNAIEAVKWYRKSAEQGNADGQFRLGYCYENGIGAATNAMEAVKWFQKSADQGNANCQDHLGYCYENGIGAATNAMEAVKWFQKSADQGNANGQDHLGYCYENGIGVATNATEAVKWYGKAAEQDNLYALSSLAWLLATSKDSKLRDGPSALTFSEKAAALSNRQDSDVLDTLAAAYAETGRFAEAVSAEKEALSIVKDEKSKEEFASRLKLYQSNTPYRQSR
jgi:TPR repeat protein/serine/threonine protein kinase